MKLHVLKLHVWHLKSAIARSDLFGGEVRHDDIKLVNVQLNPTGGRVWEVGGRCSPDQPKLPSRWKEVVRASDDGKSLIYVPAEIWMGENLDELVWKRDKA